MRRTWLVLPLPIIAFYFTGCAGQSNTSTKPSASPLPAGSTLSVSPAAATLDVFATKQFSASINGQATDAVTWEVNGTPGGSQQFGFISATGLYVAPSAAPTKSDGKGGSTTDGATISISALSTASPAVSGSATVTIIPLNRNAQGGGMLLGTSGSNAKDSVTSSNKITCCGGTLGSLIVRNETQYILSANHVLARSDAGAIGDAIVQPGLIDTPTCTPEGATTVANLSQLFHLRTDPGPKIDAAIAQVVPGTVDPSGNILLLGKDVDSNGVPLPGAPHAGFGLPQTSDLLGRGVAISGRSTGLTCAPITSISTATSVDYTTNCDGSGTKFTVNFTDQIDVMGASFSGGGDSGSLMVTQDTADPVALLYAGSDTDTVGNPIQDVLRFFSTSGPAHFVGGDAHQVRGCSLPVKPASAVTSMTASSVTPEALQRAAVVRDAHAPELLGHPEVQAVGVGPSYDNPGEPAIVFFVTSGQPRSKLPRQVDGIRTSIVQGQLFERRGAISAEESAAVRRSVSAVQPVYPISKTEFARAKAVHEAHLKEQMGQPGVQGVGITSSLDSPGEAALMIFLVRGVAHNPIPPVIDGLRTRVRESSRFRAGFGGLQTQRGCSLAPAKKIIGPSTHSR